MMCWDGPDGRIARKRGTLASILGRIQPRVQRVVCAWCGTVTKEGQEPVTHGVCPDCRETIDRQIEEVTRCG